MSLTSTNPRGKFDQLPDEIVASIVTYLHHAPPSVMFSRFRPVREVFKRRLSPLKQVSLTCRRLRRIVLPSLMKHAVLHLDELILQYANAIDEEDIGSTAGPTDADQVLDKVRTQCGFINNAVHDRDEVTLLVVCYRCMWDSPVSQMLLSTTLTRIWQTIMSVLDPTRVSLHGLRRNLGLVLGFRWRTNHSWGQDLTEEAQLVELQDDRSADENMVFDPLPEVAPDEQFILAESSLLRMGRWTRVALNEGLLRHYTGRGPAPTRLQEYYWQLMHWLCPALKAQWVQHPARQRSRMALVRHFSYTAIGANARRLLEEDPRAVRRATTFQWAFLRTLSLKLLPDPVDPAAAAAHLGGPEELAKVVADAMDAHLDVRREMRAALSTPGWSLRRLAVADGNFLATYPLGVRRFNEAEDAAIAAAGPFWTDPPIVWGTDVRILKKDGEKVIVVR